MIPTSITRTIIPFISSKVFIVNGKYTHVANNCSDMIRDHIKIVTKFVITILARSSKDYVNIIGDNKF